MNARTFISGALAAVVLAVGLAVSSGPAAAQTEEMQSPSIAVIDMQQIMRESTAVQSIQRQIDQQRSRYQEELSRKEQELRQADEELARQRTILSSEAFQERQQELEQEIGQLQQQIQSQRESLDRDYSQAMREVEKVLVEIVNDLAEERNVDVVLNKATVVLARRELEITESALDRLNSELSDVDLQALQN